MLLSVPEISNMRLLSRKISDFCRLRLFSVLPPHEAERVQRYMLDLIAQRRQPPRKVRVYDWDEIASQCEVEKKSTGQRKKSHRTRA